MQCVSLVLVPWLMHTCGFWMGVIPARLGTQTEVTIWLCVLYLYSPFSIYCGPLLVCTWYLLK